MRVAELVDYFTPELCHVWVKIVPCGSDLSLEQAGQDAIGDEPEWFTEELKESGLEGIIDMKWTPDCPKEVAFGLSRGIAPGQPFLVSILPPHWYQSGGYEYPQEWDVEWYWGIEAKVHWPPHRIIKAWETWAKNIRLEREAKEKAHKELWAKIHSDPDSLKIRTDCYWPYGCFDDMAPPSGLRLHLVSTHQLCNWGCTPVTSGSADDGEWETAWANLLANVKKYHPLLLEGVKKRKAALQGSARW